jgi:putative ABC transport system permease protein
MRPLYVLRLVIKNIINHKLRSILTITGIGIGVCFIIFLISLGYGLQRISTEEVANVEALQIIDVSPGKSTIVKINEGTIDRFRGLGNVDVAAPQTNFVGRFSYGTSTVEGVVYGKDADYLELEEVELSSGRGYTDNTGQNILINKATMRALGLADENSAMNKVIKVNVNIGPDYLEGATDPLIKEDEFKIIGIINAEDTSYAYIPLRVFRDYGVVYYSNAKVRVTDKKFTDQVKQEIESLGFKTATLKETVDQINQFFSIFQLILLSFGAIAVIIAALGMFNTLTISLLEKTREISFMKVLGTTRGDIWRLFLGEAIMIGITGTVSGIVIGLSIGFTLNDFLISLAEKSGNKPVEIFYAPPVLVVVTFAVALTISFLTGVYPSYRASKVDALETMRYE